MWRLRWVILSSLIFSSLTEARVLPMQPLVSTSSKAFVGVMIPAQALGLQHYKDLGIITSSLPSNALVQEGLEQLTSLGLYPFFIAGDLIGTVKPYKNIEYSRRTTVGLSFTFGGRDKDTLILGNEVVYGIRMDWSALKDGDLREKKGKWWSDPVTKIIEHGQLLVKGDTALKATEELLRIAAITAPYTLTENRTDWPYKSFPDLQSSPLLILTDLFSVPLQNSSALPLLPSTWTKLSDQFIKNQTTESEWKSKIEPMNHSAPLWRNLDSQSLVQSICEQMVMTLQLQSVLQPRCRVFASLHPYAFSYPGGDIFVTAGLLATIPNLDTLVFFLAHEMTHVVARHFSKNRLDQKYYNNFMNTLTLATSVISLPIPLASLAPNLIDSSRQVDVNQLQYGLATYYTKTNEFEADEMGMTLSRSLGARKENIVAGLLRLQEALESSTTEKKSTLMSTRYPDWRERVTQLQKLKIKELQADAVPVVFFREEALSILSSLQEKLNDAYLYFTLGQDMKSQSDP